MQSACIEFSVAKKKFIQKLQREQKKKKPAAKTVNESNKKRNNRKFLPVVHQNCKLLEYVAAQLTVFGLLKRGCTCTTANERQLMHLSKTIEQERERVCSARFNSNVIRVCTTIMSSTLWTALFNVQLLLQFYIQFSRFFFWNLLSKFYEHYCVSRPTKIAFYGHKRWNLRRKWYGNFLDTHSMFLYDKIPIRSTFDMQLKEESKEVERTNVFRGK